MPVQPSAVAPAPAASPVVAGGGALGAATPSTDPNIAALQGVVSALQGVVVALQGLVSVLQAQIGATASGGGPGAQTPVQAPAGGAMGAPAPPTQPSGASAPAAAPPSGPAADVGKWVTGKKDGLNPELLNRLARLGEKLGKPIEVKSGFRSRAEQEKLYAAYKAGHGNLAAKPGTSKHESGNAADVYIGGTALRDYPGATAAASEIGLKFTVPSESWHIEAV